MWGRREGEKKGGGKGRSKGEKYENGGEKEE
jgi:hypothetical protein